jgi:hypothetical protein
MTEVTQGIVEKIHTKTGQGKRGPWTKYSAVVGGEWYSFGFTKPAMNEGDEVKVQFETGQYGKDVKNFKVIANGAAEVSNAAPAAAPAGKFVPAADRERGMQWGNASNVASTLICKMADIEALPLSAASSKANKAKRYEEFMTLFNELRVELFEDALDINRVLDKVADAGNVETNTPPALPDVDTDDDFDSEVF